MLNLCLLICHTILKRECMCETMNPGPFLIIRNTFPTTFKHLLHSAILKAESTKTLLLIPYTYKNPQKYHSSSLLSSLHIYLPPLHIYLLFCIHYYLNIILTPCAWQPLGEIEGTKQSTLFAGNLEKDKEIKPTLLIPREFNYPPSRGFSGAVAGES